MKKEIEIKLLKKDLKEADLLEARTKHKDLDNRSYLLGYNDAVEMVKKLNKDKKNG